jgi:hypothetical protein
MYFALARYDGYCVSCDREQPLVLMERGARGIRAWLSGMSHHDRSLSYTCLVCGRVELVPLTDAEDVEYEATLSTWPDWSPAGQPVAALDGAPAALDLRLPPTRKAIVTIARLPVQPVRATDGYLLALAGA